jgi:hypothetical protein
MTTAEHAKMEVRLVLWLPPVMPALRRARWPSARLLVTSAAA